MKEDYLHESLSGPRNQSIWEFISQSLTHLLARKSAGFFTESYINLICQYKITSGTIPITELAGDKTIKVLHY